LLINIEIQLQNYCRNSHIILSLTAGNSSISLDLRLRAEIHKFSKKEEFEMQ